MRYSQLTEAEATDIAVMYGGRFQPMHSGHFKVYMDLVRKFGSSNVFIATTIAKNAQPEKDPFSYEEKTGIMTDMFGIPADRIVRTSPYQPDLKLTGKDPNKTAVLLVFSEKDAGRLKTGGYLRMYQDGKPLVSSDEAGYIYTVPIQDDGRSASTFRNIMRMDGIDEKKRREAFKDFFGTFNPKVYSFIKDKLNGGQ